MRGGSGTTVAAADRQAGESPPVVLWAGGLRAAVFPEAGLRSVVWQRVVCQPRAVWCPAALLPEVGPFPADVWPEAGPQSAV